MEGNIIPRGFQRGKPLLGERESWISEEEEFLIPEGMYRLRPRGRWSRCVLGEREKGRGVVERVPAEKKMNSRMEYL